MWSCGHVEMSTDLPDQSLEVCQSSNLFAKHLDLCTSRRSRGQGRWSSYQHVSFLRLCCWLALQFSYPNIERRAGEKAGRVSPWEFSVDKEGRTGSEMIRREISMKTWGKLMLLAAHSFCIHGKLIAPFFFGRQRSAGSEIPFTGKKTWISAMKHRRFPVIWICTCYIHML